MEISHKTPNNGGMYKPSTKVLQEEAMVVHTYTPATPCNHSYSGGRSRRITVLRSTGLYRKALSQNKAKDYVRSLVVGDITEWEA